MNFSVPTMAKTATEILESKLMGHDKESYLGAEALQRAIFNSTNFSKIATDANGVIQIFNVGAERMLGYTAEEVLNNITPADISDPQEIVARAAALSLEMAAEIAPGFEALVFKASRGIEDIYELTYIRKDGTRFPAVVSVTALRAADGTIIGYLLISTDNTARKRAEAALLKAGALQLAIFNSANFSSIATDARGVIQIFNVGAERMLGYTAEEVLNNITPADISDPQEVVARAQALSAELATEIAPGFEALVFKASRGIEDIYELTYIRKDGTRFPAVVSVTALRDAEDAIIGYLLIGTDNTARKQYERSLREATQVAEQANNAKSEFLANMSHEIRTPLNAVIGLSYLLEHTTLNEDQRQLLSKIQFGGRALLSVINNVLDLSKIEAGEMSLENEPFDLPELVRDLGQMLAPQAAVTGIELIVQCDPTVPQMVRGDASRLRQILTNLLGNSIKFTEAGHVELKLICTEQSSDRIRLRCSVQDTGIGIGPEMIERLFTPFTQVDASATRRFGGTGLGLSISRRFVELMGGEIGVTSELGVGSTFWIEIPLQIAHDVDGKFSAGGLRILIADSHSESPEHLATMARALGWRPQVTETGAQLLALMSKTERQAWPDVLILERQLRDMTAYQLISRLEQECTQGQLPPVIVATDGDQSPNMRDPLLGSANVLLVRPLSSSTMFNTVNAAVARQPDSLDRVLQSTSFDELSAQWLVGVSVLVVDDSDINLEVARRILEKQGATVATCSDGLAALEHLGAHAPAPDIVLMDVQMPNLDGNATTRRIRGELGMTALPIVALTAGALVGERQRALEAGMNEFISKPFDPKALIRKVRGLVEAARREPIPMVMLDTKPVGYTAGRLLMSSVDAGVVQQMFGGDRSLFESLLARVLREFVDLSLPIDVSAADQATRSHLQGRAHKLKGSAGMLGATRVMRLAGSLEVALQEGRPTQVLAEMLRQLASALTVLREEAALLPEAPANGADPGASSAVPPLVDNAQISELYSLLESQNIAAIETFAMLLPTLRGVVGAVRLQRLSDAIDNLDFQLGAQLLRETQSAGPLEEKSGGQLPATPLGA